MPAIKKNLLRYFRFFLVGSLGACSYVVGSYILTSNGMKAWIASFIVYVCLVPIVYFTQRSFVFRSNTSHSKSFLRYLIIQMMGLGMSVVLPFHLSSIGVHPIVSFLSVALFNMFVSYALQSRWAFPIKNNNRELK
jgi:putative flippase GtrA